MNQFQLDEEAIFDFARRIDSPELRAEYVDQACGADGKLKNRIAELLMTYDREQSFLERPPVELSPTTAQAIRESPGDAIGAYKLLQQIGEGGFGVVYMAEQSRPVKRKVALKIIKPGMDTKEVVARFEAERQALALMDHPNIAKVFDGGATDTGRPYFVMELVKGVPITQFCDSNKLSTRDRLKLFGEVCRAIQHAHQKGVIHRDVKPSNVMITLHDNQPVPKVIDFGVAKAISQELTEKTMFTTYGQMIGTPQYMSPEQAQMSGLDIDTRSDVYSLGVLLYELLTGTTPLDVKQLRNTAYAELQRLICESEPPKPSTKVSGLGEQSLQIASDRGVDARKLNSLLRGDLDWIVMKALEKDRNRRFESAGSLAGDVERYLSDQPILARPPSTAYQIRKFVRRNRAKVLVALTCMALTVVAASNWILLEQKDRQMSQLTEQRANLFAQLQQEIQQQAIDDALEAIQNANLAHLDEAIERAETAGASGMWMDLLKGRRDLADDHWELAVNHFNASIAANKKSVAPRANLVLAYGHQHLVDNYVRENEHLDDFQATSSYDYLFKAEAQFVSSWLGDCSRALETIEKSIALKRDCLAAYVVRAKLLVSQAQITGEKALIDRALKDIEIVSAFAQDQEAALRLRFFVHMIAAHILRANVGKAAGDAQYDQAKSLLDQHPFLREPHRDLALILFHEYTDSDDEVFKHWKRMVYEQDGVGGVAGMYGMCAIRQGDVEFEMALQKLREIDEGELGSADLNCQLGLMEIHAGNRDRAKEQYRRAMEAKSPFVRLDGQWIALLLGDRESVKQCCDELDKDSPRMSEWARFSLEVLSGRLDDREELLKKAGANRRIAAEGLVGLALLRLSQAMTESEMSGEKRKQARELLEEVTGVNDHYFGSYVAKAILHEWERNPEWPTTMTK